MAIDKDALPSWFEGDAKSRIYEFIAQVTNPKSAHFIAVEDRIATFDHDGTLWIEKPLMSQLAFYKRKLLGAEVTEEAGFFKRLFNWLGDALLDCLDLLKMLFAYLYCGITTTEYCQAVDKWITQAKHPRYKKLYSDLTYQPMLEVLALFSEHGFTNYIVSGGTSSFIRPWCEKVYNIPPEHIIGSSVLTRLSKRNGKIIIKLEPIPLCFDDGKEKVLSIERIIGKRPVAAFGNSRGDLQMLSWTSDRPNTLCMLVHHTDAQREYKYSPDRFYHLGKSTLSYAQKHNWQVIDMKVDWKHIFKHETND